jgi:hypothetical protein
MIALWERTGERTPTPLSKDGNSEPLVSFYTQQKRQGRPPAVLNGPEIYYNLFFVYCFLEFGPGGKLCDSSSSDLDSGAGLRIAPVPRLSLRHGERAEAYQCYPISFAEGGSNTVHGGINSSRGLRLADFTRTCDLVNQIGFVHSLSSQVSFMPSLHREETLAMAELGNLTARILLPLRRMSTVKIRIGSQFRTPSARSGAIHAVFGAASSFSYAIHKP